MAVLGIDFGSRRLGLAISDEEERIALPLEPVESQGSKKDLATLTALMRARDVKRVVVGLPISMDGRRGAQAEAVERFADRLREGTELPVDLLDERLTSVEAERALEATGRRGRKKKAFVDSVAAAVLLRTYLDQRQGRLS